MKRALSTLVLLVVALALGAYIYFVESKRKSASEQALEKSKVFSSLDSSTIEELRIKTPEQDTSLKKEGSAWRVVMPVTSDADESAVSGVTSNLGSLEVQRVVDEQPTDVAPFGLASPRVEVSFKAKGDAAPRVLLLGEKTATGGDMYAKLANEPRVFLVAGYLDTTFIKTTFELRDKSILKFDRNTVTRIEIASATRPLTLSKEADTWKLSAPLSARADFGAVEGLIGRIGAGQMKALVSDAATDLSTYGLDKPSSQVTLVAGSARSTLLFGSKTPDGSFYAKDASRPLVFTVDSVLTDDLTKGPDDFRPKDLYEFRTFSGSRFDITRNGVTTAFEKQKGKDATSPETWAQTQPKPAQPLESSKVEDVLSKMSNLKAQSFATSLPSGSTEVARTTARWADGKQEETVTFYRAAAGVFAVRGGEPGAASVTAADVDDAIKALDALK